LWVAVPAHRDVQRCSAMLEERFGNRGLLKEPKEARGGRLVNEGREPGTNDGQIQNSESFSLGRFDGGIAKGFGSRSESHARLQGQRGRDSARVRLRDVSRGQRMLWTWDPTRGALQRPSRLPNAPSPNLPFLLACSAFLAKNFSNSLRNQGDMGH
jgi:hypothetical protein